MRLYGFWRSIATYRVRLALVAKALEFEEISINLLNGEQHEPDFLAINPGGAVPALHIDGTILVQSAAIIEFLDERFPDRPLLPVDPVERAFARVLAFDTVADAHPLIVPRVRRALSEQFSADETAITAWSAGWLSRTLQTYADRLEGRALEPFVFGNTLGMADIAIKSHAVACGLFSVEVDPHSKVGRISAAMDAHPALKAAHPLAIKARGA